ncbi:MAG: methylenetetrahydrofolate reductase [NAD(P)H], partial [Aquificaceae bacterium]
LEPVHPTFVSVTYGAGGSTRERTKRIVERIHREINLTVMAHLTCIAHSKEEVLAILSEYRDIGIENILALRGDMPKDSKLPGTACRHASELVSLIKNVFGQHFSVGVASYPEGHPKSPNMEWEIRFFKRKVEAGADFSITQMFFENSYYYRFLDMCQKEDIDIPILPGIMPITNFKQINKFAFMCGTTIPKHLIEKMELYTEDNETIAKIGIDYAIGQCIDLLKNNAPGLHFYTLNKSKATLEIYKAIKGELKLVRGL